MRRRDARLRPPPDTLMTDAGHRLANAIARAVRATRRTLLPNLDARRYAVGRAYSRWMKDAARLDVVDDVVGHRMYLDDRDSLRLSIARVIDPAATRFIEREVRAGQTAIDLGANIGYFTLLLARHVGPGGRVYAFEPDPSNAALLKRNVDTNGYRNVELVQRAAWDATGPLRLYQSDDNRGDHRVYDSDGERRPSITIDAVRVDDFLGDEPPAVALIKMDIQGAELHALRGMERLLERNPHVAVIAEFWPAGLARAGSAPEAFLTFLSDRGFRFSLLDERSERVDPVSVESLLASVTPANGESANLLCRRA